MYGARDLWSIVGLAMLLATPITLVVAQETLPTEQAPDTAPVQPSSTLFNELGKFLKSPAEMLPSLSRTDPPVAAVPAAPPSPPAVAGAEVAPDAPKEPGRLFPGMVTGRELCPSGANGAPDCQTGSDRLCQSKGYKSGRSLNMDTAFSCSARIARSGGKACGNEHFVTSAFCN